MVSDYFGFETHGLDFEKKKQIEIKYSLGFNRQSDNLSSESMFFQKIFFWIQKPLRWKSPNSIWVKIESAMLSPDISDF